MKEELKKILEELYEMMTKINSLSNVADGNGNSVMTQELIAAENNVWEARMKVKNVLEWGEFYWEDEK